MSLYLIALEEFFFHELVQSFLNPCKFTASTTSCGKEFHGLIIHCMKNHFPLFVLNPSPPCSIWCPLALVLEKTENNCSSFPCLFDFKDLCHLPLIHNLVLNEQSKVITLTLDCLKLFFPPNGNPHWAERSERVFRIRKNKMSGWIYNISNHHHLQGTIFDLWVLGKFLSTICLRDYEGVPCLASTLQKQSEDNTTSKSAYQNHYQEEMTKIYCMFTERSVLFVNFWFKLYSQ